MIAIMVASNDMYTKILTCILSGIPTVVVSIYVIRRYVILEFLMIRNAAIFHH